MKILIGDDILEDIIYLIELLNRYEKEHHLCFNIIKFVHVTDILEYTDKVKDYEILFLSTQIEGISGIEVAYEIRKSNHDSHIVLMSESKELSYDAFGVYAKQYFIKPLKVASLFGLLDRVYSSKYIGKSSAYFIVKADLEIIKIHYNNVLYSETNKNYQNIHLLDGRIIKVRMTCTELFAMLHHHLEFIKCGASYVLNMNYFEKITNQTIVLSTGTEVSIPRGQHLLIKEGYISFISS